jgi:hypothetical protein
MKHKSDDLLAAPLKARVLCGDDELLPTEYVGGFIISPSFGHWSDEKTITALRRMPAAVVSFYADEAGRLADLARRVLAAEQGPARGPDGPRASNSEGLEER